jgi:hypothetical protein
MSLITDTWRQLVRRRLWPIAVLLLGALVAVPVLLAKSPAPAPPLPAPATAGAASKPVVGGGLEDQPVVDVADATSRGTRHVLGARKDPFAPAPQPKVKTPKVPVVKVPTTHAPTGTSPTGGSSPVNVGSPLPVSGSTPPVTGPVLPTTPTTPTTPSAPHKKLAPGTLTVRFGDASANSLLSMHVRKLDALPDSDQPVAIYVGTTNGGRTAKFLVDSTVQPEGDGRCLPSPADCQTVLLRAGETEFFTVTADSSSTTDGSTTDSTLKAGQYELDMVRIAGAKKKARASRAHHARATHARTARAGATLARVVRLLHP